jgi:hypothetical protein
MSKLFRDPIYDNMVEQDDWLNLTMQPYQWLLLEDFANIPDKIQITECYLEKDLKSYFIKYLHSTSQCSRVVQIATIEALFNSDFKLFKPLENKKYMVERPSDIRALDIYLEKTNSQIPETRIKEIASCIVGRILDETLIYEYSALNRKRLLEVHSILEAGKISKPVNKNKIRISLSLQWQTIIKEDVWCIRNMDLLMHLTNAITEYILTGCPKSLKLISVVKCMTHKGLPIYAVSEDIL